jgi:energy-coupling factor transporter ATP-binding protein EcfA2
MFALDNLKIGAFRGLRDVELDGLGRVNLLVGPNDSGKTSILEAVSIFCRPRDLRSWLNATWRREAMLNPDAPFFLAMKWMFPHLKPGDGPVECQDISISGSGKFLVRDIHATYEAKTKIGTRVSSQQTGEPYEQPGARIEVKAHFDGRLESLDEVFNLWEGEPSLLRGFSAWEAPLVQTVTPVSHRLEATQMAEWSAAAQQGLTSGILELLRSLDPEIHGADILTGNGNKPALYVDYGSSGKIPLSSLGDGIRRAFSIAPVMSSVRGGILLIDEIELSLHISALETLFSWLVRACEEFDVQLFATTHSLEAIDTMIHAEKGDLSRIVAYRLKPSEGFVKAQRLEGQLLSRMRIERGFDVRL